MNGFTARPEVSDNGSTGDPGRMGFRSAVADARNVPQANSDKSVVAAPPVGRSGLDWEEAQRRPLHGYVVRTRSVSIHRYWLLTSP